MIGKILGKRYQLVEKIASGGMSTVYKALDLNLKRYDAVKILKEEYAENPDLVNKFRQEANAVANLSHPNIVNIYNVGQEDNLNYIVMEYVKGKTLKEVIRDRGRLFENQAVNYSEQIAKALSHAHQHNIIHRDVKPHNILITDDDRVKVLDFGIAKSSNSSTITNSGKIIGSVHYFSPEQARGNTTDSRSDIYSLGIVMYEMVTGRLPFDSESPVTIALKHMQEPIQQPKLINPQISEKLNQIILKATMKDSIDRYQTMEEMLSDFKKLKNNQNLDYANQPSNRSLNRNPNLVSSTAYIEADNDDLDIDDEFDLEDKREKSRNKKLLIALLLLLLALAAVLVSVSKLFIPYLTKSTTTTTVLSQVKVPDIVGKTQEEATLILKQTGDLRLVVANSIASDKPAGTILKVTPVVGTLVNNGSNIEVTISAKKEMVKIPDVARMTEEEAKATLTKAGFKLGASTPTASDTIEKGYVIKSNPESGTNAEKGSTVTLSVSSGKSVKMTKVPDLSGKTVDEATKLLSDAKLAIGEQTLKEITEKAEDGKILSQEISAGKEVSEGTKVNITIGKLQSSTKPESKPDTTKPKNNEPFSIPDIRGMTYSQAKSTLEGLGLNISILHKDGVKATEEMYVIEYNDFKYSEGDTVQVNLADYKP